MTVVVIFFFVVMPLLGMLLFRRSRSAGARPRRSGRPPVRRVTREAPAGRIASTERGDLSAEEVEQLIVDGRLTGVLDRWEYRDLIAQLADVDEARSPLRVPGLRDE
jgi:hypothetical protein